MPLKARLDIHHENQRLVGELKTIHDINQIKTTMQRYRYPLSAAFYQELAQALTVVFIFVQTHEPFDIAVFELLPLDLQEGHEQWQSALQRFDQCWLKNEWPEAEPVTDMDDDPLMMPMPFTGSYTHLAVYKRQGSSFSQIRLFPPWPNCWQEPA